MVAVVILVVAGVVLMVVVAILVVVWVKVLVIVEAISIKKMRVHEANKVSVLR